MSHYIDYGVTTYSFRLLTLTMLSILLMRVLLSSSCLSNLLLILSLNSLNQVGALDFRGFLLLSPWSPLDLILLNLISSLIKFLFF